MAEEAPRRLPTSSPKGPWLAVATLCERVLIERDGTPSAIRMIDNVNLEPIYPPKGTPIEGVVAARFKVALLVGLKSGEVGGSYEIKVVLHAPSKDPHTFPTHTIELDPRPYGGANAVFELNLALDLESPGLHRFEIFLDDQFLTSVPLNVDIATPSAEMPT